MTRLFRSWIVVTVCAVCAGPLSASARPAPGADHVTILSLNVAGERDDHRLERAIRAIDASSPDILLLQEVDATPVGHSVAAGIGRRLGLDVASHGGLAIASRFPIASTRVIALPRYNVTFTPRDRVALAVTLATPAGLMRVYNVHLDTRINPGDRLTQLIPVIEDLQAWPESAVVGGDFNTNRHRWLFRTIPVPFAGRHGREVASLMARHGLRSAFDTGATHDVLGMRLDWIFVRGATPARRSVHPVDVSDHHALVVSLAFGDGAFSRPTPRSR